MNVDRVLHLARRAVTASPRELQTRLQQALFAAHNCVASSRGASALSRRGHLRSLRKRSEELPTWWSNREPNWFVEKPLVDRLKRIAGQEESGIPWILSRADLIVDGKMPIFSFDPVAFEGEDRWHRDFILDKTSPRDFYGFVKYLDADQVGDSKFVWEPNRFSWALWLGIAHSVTSEEKYADTFCEMTEDWFTQNPYPIGINYCSSLELAFRNYAWIWSLHFFADRLATRGDLLEKLLNGIWTGCRHIENNLSTYFAPNTHIIGEAFGLYACGAAIPEFQDAKRWRKLGRDILEEEASKQFAADGTHRELSSCYHMYSTDFYTQAMLIAKETGFELPSSIETATKRMSGRLSELATLNMSLPQFNDCDGGRLTSLVPDCLDAGPSLMAGEFLFEDLQLIYCDDEMRGYPLLMCGETKTDAKTDRARIQVPFDRELSRVYDSGIITYKTWSDDYLAFRATPFGYHDCPHSHDAGLGIVLHLNGVPVFVDSGIGSYTQTSEIRNQFRSATGKNTILVDGKGPSEPKGWFEWNRKTDCELVHLRRFEDGFVARGKHTGFSDGASHIALQREVMMLDNGIVAVVDRWDATSKVPVEARFTVHPGMQLDVARQVLHHPEHAVCFAGALLDSDEDVTITDSEHVYSPGYGQVATTRSLGFQASASQRGGMVMIFSRLGKVQRCSDRTFRFADDANGIRLVVNHDGVMPMRAALDSMAH